MANRWAKVVVMILATMVVAGCATDQSTSPAASTRTPEILPTATLMTPTASAVLPTDTPSQGSLTIDVPRGDPPTLDGALLPHEWASAREATISETSELLLMHDGEYLYLGIRAGEVGVGSICVDQGDRVKVLHSSMALGTAVYEQREDDWRVSSRFSWSCSDASDSPQAQAERTEHLETYHWLASNMSMGNPGEMEFQIAMPEGELRLAVTYLQASGGGGEEIAWWPADLPHGGCRDVNLIQAHEPNVLQFSPENWVVFTP